MESRARNFGTCYRRPDAADQPPQLSRATKLSRLSLTNRPGKSPRFFKNQEKDHPALRLEGSANLQSGDTRMVTRSKKRTSIGTKSDSLANPPVRSKSGFEPSARNLLASWRWTAPNGDPNGCFATSLARFSSNRRPWSTPPARWRGPSTDERACSPRDPKVMKSFPVQDDEHFFTVCRYETEAELRALQRSAHCGSPFGETSMPLFVPAFCLPRLAAVPRSPLTSGLTRCQNAVKLSRRCRTASAKSFLRVDSR